MPQGCDGVQLVALSIGPLCRHDITIECSLHVALWVHSCLPVTKARFVKHVIDAVGSHHLIMLNHCLETGITPDLLKHPTVHPLLKKMSLRPHSVR